MKPTVEKFRKVCAAKGGIISHIAAAFNVSRNTIYNWCNVNPEFREVLDDETEAFLDLAESQLRKLVQGIPQISVDDKGNEVLSGWKEKPSEAAVFFTLKTKGKARGYSERMDMDVTTNGKSVNREPITIEIIDRTDQVRKDDTANN